MLVETTGGETIRYIFGEDLLAEQDGAAWAYHLDDGLRSAQSGQLADENGGVTLAAARGYAPFGEPLWSEGSGATGFGFTGERWEAYTGLVFLRARYYEPGTGRFISRDPWEGDYNRPQTLLRNHLYVSNDPINDVDPTGRSQTYSCDWPELLPLPPVWLDGQLRWVNNDLCKQIDDPGASLRLIEDFYRKIVIPGLVVVGAPDAADLLGESLDGRTDPYQVSGLLGRQLLNLESHKVQLANEETKWLSALSQEALSMACNESRPFKPYESTRLSVRGDDRDKAPFNVRFAMADHWVWFTRRGDIERTCNGWKVSGDFDRDIADYSNWHGDPHDYDGDGALERPEGDCGKKASFPIPGFGKITIPDEWMARLVIGGEASNPGFQINHNTRESFQFSVDNWSPLPKVKYKNLRSGEQYRDHEWVPVYP